MAPTYYLTSYQRLLKWVWIQLFYIIEPTAAHNQPLMNGVWDPFRSWSLLTSISFSPYCYQSEYLNQFSNIMRRQTQGTYVQSLARSLQVDDVPLLNCFQPHCTASSEHRSVQNFSLNFTFQDIQELLDLPSLGDLQDLLDLLYLEDLQDLQNLQDLQDLQDFQDLQGLLDLLDLQDLLDLKDLPDLLDLLSLPDLLNFPDLWIPPSFSVPHEPFIPFKLSTTFGHLRPYRSY